MSMFKLQIVLVPPKALDLQIPNIPVNSTPNNSMNWQNNSNAKIRVPNFNVRQNNNFNNTSLIMNNEATKNLQNMKLKLNQMIAYKNYLFQKNCKKFLLFINLQSDLNDLADEILIKFNKLYPGYNEDLNILTIQDLNGNDLDPDFIIRDVFNASNVVKVLIEKDIDWDNPNYLGSKFGSVATHKRRKLNPKANNRVNTTVVTNNTSLRFTTPIVHEFYRDIDSIMMDQSIDKSMDKSMDKSILLPPSKPQAPQIRISSGVDHSKILITGQAQIDTISKSEIVDPDKSKQHILHTQPIVLADQSSPKGTLLGTPVMTVISPNKLTASEQKSYSTSNNQIMDTVIHHSPTASSSTNNLSPPLKTPRNNDNDIIANNNNILPVIESNNTKAPSTENGVNHANTSVIEESKEVSVPMPRFDRPSALSKSMRASLQRQQSTIANDKGSPVKNGPLSDVMNANVHLAELPTKNNITVTSSFPQSTESNIKAKSILEKIMEQQRNSQSSFGDLTDRQSQKDAKEIKKRQIINHNSYIPSQAMNNVTKDYPTSVKQIQENSSVVHDKAHTVSILPEQTNETEPEKPKTLCITESGKRNISTSEQEIINELSRKETIKPAKPAERSKHDITPRDKKTTILQVSTVSKSNPPHAMKIDTNTEKNGLPVPINDETLTEMGSKISLNASKLQPKKSSNEVANIGKAVAKTNEPASISVSRKAHLKYTSTENTNRTIANRSADILSSTIDDKGGKGIENSNTKVSNILNGKIDKVSFSSQISINSEKNQTEISQSQPVGQSKQTWPLNNNPEDIVISSYPLAKSKTDEHEEANTSVGNNSFQKSDLLRMFENNKLNNPPWLSKSHNPTARRVIGKARNKPYLTVLNKDIDNSKPDPRNILPSRTPRNAAQKATMKLSGQTNMFGDPDNPVDNNIINGSEEFESYSESSDEDESSSSAGIMTDVSSDEEDIATLAKATPNVKVTKPNLKESVVRHASTDSDKDAVTNQSKGNKIEHSKNISSDLPGSIKPSIQLTKTTDTKKALSETDKLLDTDLSDFDDSINTRKGKASSKYTNTTPTSPKLVNKVPIASKRADTAYTLPKHVNKVSLKSTPASHNTDREVTPPLSNTVITFERTEGTTPDTLIFSDEADQPISSIDKKYSTKPPSKLTTQSKLPKYFEYPKNGKTAAFMDYLNNPKVGEDLLLDLDSTDSADDADFSSSSDSSTSIDDIRTASLPLDNSRHGSDLDDEEAISKSSTDQPRSASSMLHSIQEKSASTKARNGLEAVTNTSTNLTSMTQRLNNTSSRGIPTSVSIDIAPSSDAVSDQEIDNDIPETSSDYESSGVELDD
ncbi:hypothetical protein MOSE0_I07514 [Monosporozyma servazzii]